MGSRITHRCRPKPDRNVQTSFEHPEEREIEKAERLFARRMANIFTALQQTVHEAPGMTVLHDGLKPLAASAIEAHTLIEAEIRKLERKK